MTFDASSFADTVHTIRRDLERVAETVAWLYPTAYEQRAGGHSGGGVCNVCGGVGRTCPMPHGHCVVTGGTQCVCREAARHQPCDECVVATITGDAGEIVVRRQHIADHLAKTAREVDRVWEIVKGLRGRMDDLGGLIDRGADQLPGIGAPTVDPHEVIALNRARRARVERGEVLPPTTDAAREAAVALKGAVRQADVIAQAEARRVAGDKRGNHWRG